MILIRRVLLSNQVYVFKRLLPVQYRAENMGDKMRKLGMVVPTWNPSRVPPLISYECLIQLRGQGYVHAVEGLTCRS